MEQAVPAFVSSPELFGSELLAWSVIGLAIYWVAILLVRRLGLLPSFIGAQGPIVTIHTKRGQTFLTWLAGPKRFWRAWANIGIGISLVVMVAMFLFLLSAAIGALTSPPVSSSVQQPRNVLVIPGVNDFLPLSATPGIAFGLLVGLVVHEGGHGLLCRVEDIDINSMGVAMLAILPIGAFVEPDQKSSKAATRGGQTRMFAAGVTNNFAITIVAFALLFGPVAGSIAVAPGAAVGGVASDSPAAEAGIEPNDRITAINGTPVESNDELTERIEAVESSQLAVELNGERTVTVDRSLLVTGAMENGPTGLDIGDAIVAVNGQPVATERGFYEAVGEDERVTLTVERADTNEQEDIEDVPIGAAVTVIDDEPLAGALGETDETFVITRVGGERTHSQTDLQSLLDESSPGDDVTVAGYLDGDPEEVTVTLGENPRSDSGFLGIAPNEGVSGLTVNDLGVQLYPADEYLALLGGDGDSQFGAITDSFLGKIGLAIMLPIIAVVGALPFNFAGFTGGVQNFYEVQGSLATLGDSTIFIIANLLFWTGWINVQLGFFNCIPAFPLDGGHILRTSTEAIISRLPIDSTRGMVRLVTTAVGLLMLMSFLAMLFAPGLLAG